MADVIEPPADAAAAVAVATERATVQPEEQEQQQQRKATGGAPPAATEDAATPAAGQPQATAEQQAQAMPEPAAPSPGTAPGPAPAPALAPAAAAAVPATEPEPLPRDVLKEGCLSKAGVINTGLKRRFFRLTTAGEMVYFKSKKDKSPKGSFHLNNVTERKVQGAMLLLTDNKGRVWKLKADSESEAASWHEAIVKWCLSAEVPSPVDLAISGKDRSSRDPFYDLTVRINSFNELKTGWPVVFGGKNPMQMVMQSIKNVNHTVVTVDGLFNRGKTHLLSGISGTALPSEGSTKHTEGLCFKSATFNSSQASILFVDAAGSRMPVPCGTRADDRKATDHFLRILKLRLAQCVLLVVNHLTFDDQEYIDEMLKIIPIDTQMMVVHNLPDISSKEDLLQCIYTDIVMAFGGRFAHQVVSSGKEAPYWEPLHGRHTTHHFVLARDGSEAGKLVNHVTYEFLKQKLCGVKNQPVNMCEKFEAVANDVLNSYITCKNKEKNAPKAVWDWSTNSIHLAEPVEFELRSIHVFQFTLQQTSFIHHMVVEHIGHTVTIDSDALENNALVGDWVEIIVNAPGMMNLQVHLDERCQMIRVKGNRPVYTIPSDHIARILTPDQGSGPIDYPVQLPFEVNPFTVNAIFPGKLDDKNGIIWSYLNGVLSIWVPKATSKLMRVTAKSVKEAVVPPEHVDANKEVPDIPPLPERGSRRDPRVNNKWLDQFWIMADYFGAKW